MRGEWDRARNHDFLGDRGAPSTSPNARIEEMAIDNFNTEEEQSLMGAAAKTMGLLDMRSRRELVKAIQTGTREVELKATNGGKWSRVMSVSSTSD